MIEKFISEQLPADAAALAGKYRGTLLILAGGRSIWADYAAWMKGNFDNPRDVMAVNDVGMFFGMHLEHWFSLHGAQLPAWNAARGFHWSPAAHLHTVKKQPNGIPWPVPQVGTSTLSAVYVGLCLGYDRIILCGAPLDDNGHFFDPPWAKTNFSNECLPDVWREADRKIFEGKVKSMSGLSREILGAP